MLNDAALRLVPAAFESRDTQALVAEVQAEYTLLYGAPDEAPVDKGEFDPPDGAFFLGYEGNVAVAMGGWRTRSDVHPWGAQRVAEVKRMYVAPAARRRGHARALLTHLESTARLAGVEALVLETGTAQPEAIAMYTASGYEPIESFGWYAWSPLSRCFGKRLRA
jgi:GNAT superfamily N-acetyltransferase